MQKSSKTEGFQPSRRGILGLFGAAVAAPVVAKLPAPPVDKAALIELGPINLGEAGWLIRAQRQINERRSAALSLSKFRRDITREYIRDHLFKPGEPDHG